MSRYFNFSGADSHDSGSYSYRTLNFCFLLAVLLVVVALLHRYMATDGAAVILLVSIFIGALSRLIRRPKVKVHIIRPVFWYSLFCTYLICRFDFSSEKNQSLIFEQVFCLVTFSLAAIIASHGGFRSLLPLIGMCYLLIFCLKVLSKFYEVRNGYNLWSGYVVFTLLPLVLMLDIHDKIFRRRLYFWLPLIMSAFLFALSARAAAISVFMFWALLHLLSFMPFALRNSLFPMVIVLVGGAVVFYLDAQSYEWMVPLEQHSRDIFGKSLFSGRHTIWVELIEFIKLKFWFGWGADHSSHQLMASSGLRNLSSHNTFLEIWYRLGFTGVVLFLMILYSIWRVVVVEVALKPTRVVASFLLAAVVFMSSNGFLFDSILTVNLVSWLILGVGVGLSKAPSRVSDKSNKSRNLLARSV